MRKRQVMILFTIVLGILPIAVSADTMNIDVPVVVTWSDFISHEYSGSASDWYMCIDLEMRCHYWNDILTHTVTTDIEPFHQPGRGQVAGPFTVTWPSGLRNTAQIYGRVRWHADDAYDIIGDWTYIQDVTGTVTTLYFPLGIAPAP